MESSTTPRFRAAIDRIDRANAEDPNRALHDGREWPKELLYAERITRWLERLEPGASEALRLAVRAQHIRRWEVPRGRFPMDRRGYHQWRTEAARHHARVAAAILRDVGYDEATVARVESLLRKERLKKDPETQALEDAACLVFLEDHFADFARQHDEEKLVSIVRKTWGKMSERGHELALGIELGPRERDIVARALGQEGEA